MKYIINIIIFIFIFGCYENERGTSIPQKTANQIFVSQKFGNDSLGNGSEKNPYKTITKAISESNKSNSIIVKDGNYSEEIGEIFPIKVPKNINLIGSSDGDNNISIIGFGEYNGKNISVILDGDSKLENLTISSKNNIGVLSKDGNNSLFYVNLINNEVALGITNSSYIVLLNSVIKDNSYSGVELSDNSIIKLLNSTIKNNNIGISVIDNSIIDKNSDNLKIINNKQCDLYIDNTKDIYLINNIQWDDDVFNFEVKRECIDGNNIVNIGASTVYYQPLPLTIDENNDTIDNYENLNSLLFPHIRHEIKIISPLNKKSIGTNTPTIKYTNVQYGTHIIVTLWDKLPIIQNKHIINSENIIWYWHTGMRNSPIGYVEYNNGVNPINGDLSGNNEVSPPKPLKRGRIYYLAIWEWDDKGEKIISSSKINYFNIIP